MPGVAGSNGASGSNGTNGINAFSSIVGGASLVPAYGASETVELAGPEGSLWVGQGQTLFVQSYGYFRVDGIPDPTHVTLFNLGYAGNVDGDSIITFPAGTRVQPGGIEGPSGSASGDAFLIANNLSEGDAATMRNNLGLGTAATQNVGAFFQVANNLSEGTPATMRTNLELGTAAVDDVGIGDGDIVVNDGALTPGDCIFATADGIETKTAANARLALGIAGQVGAYILAQQILASGGTESPFNTGSDIPVPISDLVEDETGVVTLNAGLGQLTLPVGTYRVRISVPGVQCDNFQTWLYNFTNNVVELVGSSAFSAAADATTAFSLINGLLVVSGGPKAYGILARCGATGTFGVGVSFGQNFVTTSWELEQES